jgi:hypothetical protein
VGVYSTVNFYTSVQQAYLDLRVYLKRHFSVHKDLGTNDIILKKTVNETDIYLRLRLKTGAGISSIGLEFGSDPDLLELTPSIDPETQFPATVVSPPEQVLIDFNYDEDSHIFNFTAKQGTSKYEFIGKVLEMSSTIFHQNWAIPKSEPNFKKTGTPYIKCGA